MKRYPDERSRGEAEQWRLGEMMKRNRPVGHRSGTALTWCGIRPAKQHEPARVAAHPRVPVPGLVRDGGTSGRSGPAARAPGCAGAGWTTGLRNDPGGPRTRCVRNREPRREDRPSGQQWRGHGIGVESLSRGIRRLRDLLELRGPAGAAEAGSPGSDEASRRQPPSVPLRLQLLHSRLHHGMVGLAALGTGAGFSRAERGQSRAHHRGPGAGVDRGAAATRLHQFRSPAMALSAVPSTVAIHGEHGSLRWGDPAVGGRPACGARPEHPYPHARARHRTGVAGLLRDGAVGFQETVSGREDSSAGRMGRTLSAGHARSA